MAGARSASESAAVLEASFGGVTYSPQSQLWFGLWTTALDKESDGDTAGECDYTGYTRVAVDNDQTTGWNPSEVDAGTVTVTNLSDIEWPECTGGSNTVVSLAIIDAETSGLVVAFCDLASQAISTGDTPKITAGNLSISEVAT